MGRYKGIGMPRAKKMAVPATTPTTDELDRSRGAPDPPASPPRALISPAEPLSPPSPPASPGKRRVQRLRSVAEKLEEKSSAL